MCYGQLGSPITNTALKMGIAEGTVVLYCRRVTQAIRELHDWFGSWMSETEQKDLESRIFEKIWFPKYVGSGNGSLIPADQMPALIGSNYLGRKGFFGVCILSLWLCWCII